MTPYHDTPVESDPRRLNGSNAWLGRFIAEVKNRSPFGMTSGDSWEFLLDVALEYGDAISVHTDPRWNGRFEDLRRARALTNKPILAKGIHATDDEVKRAIDYGADAVLVVGRLPAEPLLPKCWLEPTSIAELKMLPPCLAVWNARDLSDGTPKEETWDEARCAWNGILCQASLIRHQRDIKSDADCFIVGEYMPSVAIALSTV